MIIFKIKTLYLKILSNPLIMVVIKSSVLVFLIFLVNGSFFFDNVIINDSFYVVDSNNENTNLIIPSDSTNETNLKKKDVKINEEWSLFDCFLFFIIIAFGFNALADDPWHIRCRK